MRRTRLILLAVLLLLPACKLNCLAPQAAELSAPIAAKLEKGRDSEGSASFDHEPYEKLLQAHVRYETGRVDYAGLKEDEAKLDAYLMRIADADLDALGADPQLALLLNAYNAFTLKLILEHYPGVKSIKKLDDPWGTKRWNIGGEKVSLDDIEHGLIRPVFKDPRIHFAVNCASIGCPPLADFAFDGADVDNQLTTVTTNALGNERHAKVENGTLHLTKIMQWYGDDFTKEGWSPTAESIPQFAAKYGPEEIRELVDEKGGDTPLEYLEYDWSLNDEE